MKNETLEEKYYDIENKIYEKVSRLLFDEICDKQTVSECAKCIRLLIEAREKIFSEIV